MFKTVAKCFSVETQNNEYFTREFYFVDLHNAEAFLEQCSECLDFYSGYVVSEITGEVMMEK